MIIDQKSKKTMIILKFSLLWIKIISTLVATSSLVAAI